jgi:hypothetical protein
MSVKSTLVFLSFAKLKGITIWGKTIDKKQKDVSIVPKPVKRITSMSGKSFLMSSTNPPRRHRAS